MAQLGEGVAEKTSPVALSVVLAWSKFDCADSDLLFKILDEQHKATDVNLNIFLIHYLC